MTISSSAQLPARSPMPLIVHSTCRRPSFDAGQAVGDGQAQVVVAVDADDDLVDVRARASCRWRMAAAYCVRHGVADGVGNVHRRGAGLDGRLDDLGEEVQLGAGGVLGRELDVLADSLGALARPRRRAATISSLAIFSLNSRWMALVARKTWMRGSAASLERFAGAVDVGVVAAGQAADDRPAHFAGDGLHRLEIAGRRDREAGLDDVHAQVRKRVGDLQLLGQVHAGAGRLLAVAQRRVENQNAVRIVRFHGAVLENRSLLFYHGDTERTGKRRASPCSPCLRANILL